MALAGKTNKRENGFSKSRLRCNWGRKCCQIRFPFLSYHSYFDSLLFFQFATSFPFLPLPFHCGPQKDFNFHRSRFAIDVFGSAPYGCREQRLHHHCEEAGNKADMFARFACPALATSLRISTRKRICSHFDVQRHSSRNGEQVEGSFNHLIKKEGGKQSERCNQCKEDPIEKAN